MPIPSTNSEIYTPDSAEELRDQLIKDYANGLRAAGLSAVSTLPGSEFYIRATALANLGLLAFLSIEETSAKNNELNATGSDLDAIREALGLPEVLPSPSSGKVIVQVSTRYDSTGITYPDGLEGVLDSGIRIRVYGTHSGIVNGSEVNVIALDTGSKGNTAAGARVKWANPPVGSFSEATVGSGGLTGGNDSEGDEAKRARILQARKYKPGCGNAGHLLSIAESNLSVAKGYVYPAIGGAGSVKVALSSNDANRQVSATTVAEVTSLIQAQVPECIEVFVQSVVSEPVDLSLQIKTDYLNSYQNTGFLDSKPYPAPDQSGYCYYSAHTSDSITISKNFGIPLAGKHIMIYDTSGDGYFTKYAITDVTEQTNDYVIALDGTVTTADNSWVSPTCVYADEYLATIKEQLLTLGCGENKSDPGRSARIPYTGDMYFPSINNKQLAAFLDTHSEVDNATWLYRSKTSPTIPALASTAPNILTLGKVGIYSV